MSPFRSPSEPFVDAADPNLESSITLEAEVHKDAMPSGPGNPASGPKPKKAERILLRAEDYASSPNGAVVAWEASIRRLIGSVGARAVRFVRAVPGSASSGVHVGGGLASSGGFEEGGTCSVAGEGFGAGLGVVPALSMADVVDAAVEKDAWEAVDEIMAKLAMAEAGGDGGGGEDGGNLDTVGEGQSDTVLVTVWNCLDGDGTGYIEMRAVGCGDRGEQDHFVSFTGSRF